MAEFKSEKEAVALASQFYQGFACALAEINRKHDQPTMVCDVMRGYGMTLADLHQAGVDDYDLNEIATCLRQGNIEDRLQVTPSGALAPDL